MDIVFQWCTDGLPDIPVGGFQLGNTTVTLIGTNGILALAFTDSGSGISSDGRCLRIAATSEETTTSLIFREANILFTPGPAAPPARRRRAAEPTFGPLTPYLAGLVTTAVAGSVVDPDATSIALEDTQPPTFLDCPTSDIHVTAAAAAIDVPASWTVPTAVDNIDPSPTVEGPSPPSGTFSILDSPHTITYTASDGVQTTTCTFAIVVEYTPRLRTVTDSVNATFPTSVSNLPSLFTQRVSQTLIAPGLGVLEALPMLDTDTFTDLSLELTTPPGQPLVFKTRADVTDAQVAVNLVYLRDGTAPPASAPAAQTDIQARLELRGYELDMADSVQNLTDAEREKPLPQESIFRTGAAAVDPASGYIGLTAAFSVRFRRGVVFTSLAVVLQLPAGRASAGGLANWTLAAGSSLRVEYDYSLDEADAAATTADVIAERGGFVALLDTQSPFFLLCDTAALRVPTLPGANYSLPFWRTPQDDDNSGSTTLTGTHQPLTPFALTAPAAPAVRVRYTSTDSFGNTAICEFDVRTVDEEPPVIIPPSPLLVELPAMARAVNAFVPLAALLPTSLSDNSGHPPTLLEPITDMSLGVGRHLIALVAQDAWGNSATRNITVNVVDVTPPTITCPADLKVAGSDETSVMWSPVTADDNDFDGSGNLRPLRINTSLPSGSLFPAGVNLVEAFAEDSSGNVGQCNFTVTVMSAPSTTASTTALGGAGGGAAVLLLLLIVCGVLLRRAQLKTRAPQDWNEIFKLMDQFQKPGEDGPIFPREIARGAMTLLDELGKGAFGLVYKAILKESVYQPGYLVAAKSLHEKCTAGDRQELLEEAAVMAQFHHPHVTALVGVVTVGKPTLVVVEYMEHGSLKGYLEKHEVTRTQQVLWAGDVAEGLAHVHSKVRLYDRSFISPLLCPSLCCSRFSFSLACLSCSFYFLSLLFYFLSLSFFSFL